MKDLLVLVGLIGSGKTAEARRIRDGEGYYYIDFDIRWHEVAQPKMSAAEFVDQLAEEITEIGLPTVIDGWWTWVNRWWDREEDDTLDALEKACPDHKIRVGYLALSAKMAEHRYREKRNLVDYTRQPAEISDLASYIDSIPDRIAALELRILRFVAWGPE